MIETTNTANPTRTTVLVRTTSGAEHTLSTPPGSSKSTDSFEVRLNNHKSFYGNQFMSLELIDGTTLLLNPSAIESFRAVPVPRHTSADIRKGTITYGAYVDEDPNL